MVNIDVTSKIERLEVFEERLGVRIESLSAFLTDYRDDNLNFNNDVRVRGELQAREGTELQQDVDLVMAVYDSSGRVIATSSNSYYAGEFFGLETFELTVEIPMNQVAKIRVYPKKR